MHISVSLTENKIRKENYCFKEVYGKYIAYVSPNQLLIYSLDLLYIDTERLYKMSPKKYIGKCLILKITVE